MESKPSNTGLKCPAFDRYQKARQIADTWLPFWRDCARWTFPRRTPGLTGSLGSFPPAEERLWDATAVRATMTNAAGCLSNMAPISEAWFDLAPQELDANSQDGVGEVYQKMSRILQEERLRSNFYGELHEAFLDMSACGSGCMLHEWADDLDRGSGLHYTHIPIGSFAWMTNHRGVVSELYRWFSLRASAALEKWGQACSDKIKAAAEKNEPKEFLFVHAVYPAPKPPGGAPPEWPWLSYYFEGDTGMELEKGGYVSKPFTVGRYYRGATAGGGIYGIPPICTALPETRQVNRLQRNLDRVADRLADPPLFAPEELEGEIDVNPGGVTYFAKGEDKPEFSIVPTGSQVEHELARIQARQQSIEDAFHLDLFELLARKNKEMTAFEVDALLEEKLDNFLPVFVQRAHDMLEPGIRRDFDLCVEHQKIPIDQRPNYTVVYRSKLAKALESRPGRAYQKAMGRVGALMQMGVQDAGDIYDWDAAERNTATTEGIHPDALRDPEEITEMRDARAKQQAQDQQAMAALEAAKALK